MQNLNNILKSLLSEQTEMYNMTQTDLKLMLMYYIEPNSELIADKLKGDPKLVASARRLERLGLAEYSVDVFKLDDSYKQYLLRNSLIENDGEMTEKGKEILRT